MSDTDTTTDPKPADPKTTVTPLSIVTMGPLNALIFRKDTAVEGGGVASEVFVNIKRTASQPTDDPTAIPIMEVPALVMMLKAIAEPAMAVRTLEKPTPPAPKAKSRKGKKA